MGSARAKQDYFVMDLGKSKKSLRLILITVLLLGFSHASAQEAGAVGTVTNLPLPRFVSLNASEANVRRGPSLNHRIDWVFVRKGTPLQITGGRRARQRSCI